MLFCIIYTMLSMGCKLWESHMCVRRSPKVVPKTRAIVCHLETPEPILGNTHPQLWDIGSTWTGWPRRPLWSSFGYELLLLFLSNCPCGPTITMKKIKFPFLVHLPRIGEISFHLYPAKWDFATICSGLLKTDFWFHGKDLVFQGDVFLWF